MYSDSFLNTNVITVTCRDVLTVFVSLLLYMKEINQKQMQKSVTEFCVKSQMS